MYNIDLEMNKNVGQDEVQSITLPSQLYWRSTLGTPAAWSGSSSRGVYLMDDDNKNGGSSLIQNLVVDKRMLRLPASLRDIVIQNLLSTDDRTPNHRRRSNNKNTRRKQPPSTSNIQLLSHPRIVGSSQSTTLGSSTFFSSTNNNRANNGIACMDIDNGNDDTITGSPSRYLLVGSNGGDCTIALYDLSYFGSDGYLYQQQKSSTRSNNITSQSSTSSSSLASVTHRPIAKSIRHQSSTTSIEQDASAVPSGHKHPLLGCKWYPGDVKQMFVSASISGEILIWDVSNFVPVFATYAHIYTGISRGNNNDNEDNGGKTVSPLQCMDIPKSPEGCPNGNALLALGLGSSGRGVIQLCDAFRGGSATHEFVGHNGGVNSILWDPYHPFRLASGGDDCTIRLWDIRKAGSAACLGILNRENEMFSGVGDVSSNDDDDYSTAIRKKQRASLNTKNNIRTGIESHGTPVTALAFAPGGDDLVSTGLDGKIQHWDLRLDSCFVSSMDAITSGKSSRDPSVATGGRLYPTSFTDGSSNNNRSGLHNKASSKRRRSYHYNKPSLAIMQSGSRSTTTLISTSSSTNNASSRGQITGYSLFGRRGKEPGCCDFTLNGHLSDVTCLLPITTTWDSLSVNSRSTNTNHTVSFLTGGLDGMVLSWGSSRRRQYTVSSTDSTHDISFNSNMPYSSSSAHHTEQPSEDLDNW